VNGRIPGLIALIVACAALVACGPAGPVEPRGSAVDPVAMLSILPSPGALRGAPAARADESALQMALTGESDGALVEVLEGRGLSDAAVRSWQGPDGQELVAVISVWDSHLLATGIGGQAAEFLLAQPGGRAWTPRGLGGSRGARVDTPGAEQRRLAFAVGPNSIYVRSRGPVDEEVVRTAMERMVRSVRAESG
jgi:hypothetical protein